MTVVHDSPMPTHTKRKDLARILRAVLRLVETDVRELADSVVEIDHRTAEQDRRIDALENIVIYHAQAIGAEVGTQRRLTAHAHSRKV